VKRLVWFSFLQLSCAQRFFHKQRYFADTVMPLNFTLQEGESNIYSCPTGVLNVIDARYGCSTSVK